MMRVGGGLPVKPFVFQDRHQEASVPEASVPPPAPPPAMPAPPPSGGASTHNPKAPPEAIKRFTEEWQEANEEFDGLVFAHAMAAHHLRFCRIDALVPDLIYLQPESIPNSFGSPSTLIPSLAFYDGTDPSVYQVALVNGRTFGRKLAIK